MANTFKVKTNDAMPSSAGTPLTLYTCPSSTTCVVIGLTLCNVHSTSVTASVKIDSNTSDTETIVAWDIENKKWQDIRVSTITQFIGIPD